MDQLRDLHKHIGNMHALARKSGRSLRIKAGVTAPVPLKSVQLTEYGLQFGYAHGDEDFQSCVGEEQMEYLSVKSGCVEGIDEDGEPFQIAAM
jgi:hypothetical protein